MTCCILPCYNWSTILLLEVPLQSYSLCAINKRNLVCCEYRSKFNLCTSNSCNLLTNSVSISSVCPTCESLTLYIESLVHWDSECLATLKLTSCRNNSCSTRLTESVSNLHVRWDVLKSHLLYREVRSIRTTRNSQSSSLTFIICIDNMLFIVPASTVICVECKSNLLTILILNSYVTAPSTCTHANLNRTLNLNSCREIAKTMLVRVELTAYYSICVCIVCSNT